MMFRKNEANWLTRGIQYCLSFRYQSNKYTSLIFVEYIAFHQIHLLSRMRNDTLQPDQIQ